MDLIPSQSTPFIKVSGTELLERIGREELRTIVAGVLCGENVRAATEPLTRRRISILSAALVVTLFEASKWYLPSDLAFQAEKEIRGLPASDVRRTMLMWIAGMTGKQIQNVLRSDDDAWRDYISAASEALEDSVENSTSELGDLKLDLQFQGESQAWDWAWTHALMTAVGSQTLATRGAEKSMYGKLFEKLVLGSVLGALGFTFDPDRTARPSSFWLSERGEKRESDATLIIDGGQGVRFDIGFIGPGNTEISLDKASRFGRVDEVAGKRFDMETIIIIDRIGDRSRIVELAREIGATILQMSSSLWAQDLDNVLSKLFPEYVRQLSDCGSPSEVRSVIHERLGDEEFELILQNI